MSTHSNITKFCGIPRLSVATVNFKKGLRHESERFEIFQNSYLQFTLTVENSKARVK